MFRIIDSFLIKISNFIDYKIINIDTEHKFIEVTIQFGYVDNLYGLTTREEKFTYIDDPEELLYHKKLEDGTLDTRYVTSIITEEYKEILPNIIENIKNKINNISVE